MAQAAMTPYAIFNTTSTALIPYGQKKHTFYRQGVAVRNPYNIAQDCSININT